MALYIRNLPKKQQETRGRNAMTVYNGPLGVEITVDNLYAIQSIRRFGEPVTYTPENSESMWSSLVELAEKLTQNLKEVEGKKLKLVKVHRYETVYSFA